MSCAPYATVTLPAIVQGDTWDGFSVVMSSDGTSLDEPLAGASLVFYDGDGTAVLTLTEASGITINDAAAWDVTVDAITPFALTYGTYSLSLKLTNDEGRIKTWLKYSLSVTKP